MGDSLTLVIYLVTVGLIAAATGDQYKTCEASECSGANCPRNPCLHGDCSASGTCICSDACWTGARCDVFDNVAPNFSELYYTINVGGSTGPGDRVGHVTALDDDAEYKCHGNKHCACARVLYRAVGGSAYKENLFEVDANTGAVHAKTFMVPYEGRTFTLDVIAYNQPEGEFEHNDVGHESSVTVTLHVGDDFRVPADMYRDGYVQDQDGYGRDGYGRDGYGQDGYESEEDEDTPHHRGKRSVTYPAVETVGNVTFYLYKTGDNENATELRIGNKVHFVLLVHFPVDTTDMLVELFTPDNETTVMSICNVQITHVGSNLDIVAANVTPVLESKDGSTNYDRAILDFGNVTNSGSNTGLSMYHLARIEWDAVMLDNNQTQNGSTYWVSAGAEYKYEEEIWVGQASFTTVLDTFTPTESPSFNYSGPVEVAIGTSATFRVDMFIPYDAVVLAFDSFAPINDTNTMSVCSMAVVDVGPNYACLETHKIDPVLYPLAGGKGNERGRLNIGKVINTGARLPNNPTADNRISVEFVLYLWDDAALVGKELWVGAAVEVGDSEIWAGQIKVVATTPTPVNSTASPTVSIRSLGEVNVTVGTSVVYELDVVVPGGSVADWELEVLTSFNDSAARARMCEVSILYRGFNVPCTSETKPVYTARDTTTDAPPDKAVWKVGRVVNTNFRTEVQKTNANLVRFRIVTQVLNHTLNTPGEKLWLTAGLTYGPDRLWVGQKGVVLYDSGDLGATVTPNFTLSYSVGDEYVHVGGQSQVTITVTAIPGVVHEPMDVELILPYNDTAILSVCRAELTRVGKNLPCIDRKKVNASVTYDAKDGVVNDKAVMALGTVCNVRGLASTDLNLTTTGTEDPDDDSFDITLTFKVEDHVSLVNGTKNWVSAGIMYAATRMWVGQVAQYSITDMFATFPIAAQPYVSVVRADNYNVTDSEVGVGSCAVYHVLIKPQRGTTGDITVTADVTGAPALSICAISVLQAGFNLGCMKVGTVGNLTARVGTDTSESGLVSMDKVTNVGNVSESIQQNDTYDADSLVVSVVVYLAAGIPLASTHTLSVQVAYGDPAAPSPTPTTTAVTLTATDIVIANETKNDTMPTFTFTLGDMANETAVHEIARSEAKKFNFEMSVAPGSSNYYLIKFLTSVNHTDTMELCSVIITYVGRNLPCLKRSQFAAVYSNRPLNSITGIGSIDLGTVCHVQLGTNPEDNIIRFEAVAKLVRDATVTVGEKIWFSATARINTDQIYVAQIGTIVTDIINFNETFHDTNETTLTFNVTSGPVIMSPGQHYTVDVDVRVPANCSVLGLVDVTTPVNLTAVMTIDFIKLVSAGRNLACLASRPSIEYTPTYNSTQLTTQNDRAFLDLGVLTNTGVTYRNNSYQEGDNEFRIQIGVWLADALVNEDLSLHWLSMGVRVGRSIVVAEKRCEVHRDNLEQPELYLTALVINEQAQYVSGNTLVINATLQHKTSSTAEGYNVSTTFYYPAYMLFASITDINFTMPTVSDVPNNAGVMFTFERLFFTDVVTWQFELTVQAVVGDFTGTANGTTPYQSATNMIWRANNANTSGTFFVSRLDSVSFKVIPPLSVSCTAGALGMKDGSIQNCQITTSSPSIPGKDGSMGRMDGSSGWSVGARGYNFQKYMQVDFGNVTKLTKVALQHPVAFTSAHVTSYALYYSMDGLNWAQGESHTPIPGYGTDVFTLSAPTDTQHVRLVLDDAATAPQTDDFGLRVEFYGCVSYGGVLPEDVCNAKRSWDTNTSAALVPWELYTRGVVVSGSTSFVCDTNPLKNNTVECFTSTDGTTWKALDDTVLNVLGHSAADGNLYGIAFDRRSFVRSEDSGATWRAIPPSKLQEAAAAAGWTASNPNRALAWLPTFDVTYGATAWHSKFDGVYFGATKSADWTKCCR